MTEMTVAEALAALEAATQMQEGVPPRTFTLTQIANSLGAGKERTHNMIRDWLAAGHMSVVTYKKRALDGRLATVRGFQFAEPPKGKRKRG